MTSLTYRTSHIYADRTVDPI